jgi:hypothetical protein
VKLTGQCNFTLNGFEYILQCQHHSNGSQMKLKALDVVRTKFGTIAVVSEVGVGGRVSLVLPKNSTQKVAWYHPDELEMISAVDKLVKWWDLG